MDLGGHKVTSRGKSVNLVQVSSTKKVMSEFLETSKIFYWEIFGIDTNHHA